MMQILQCGYPKSGNYLLYKIIRRLIENNDSFFSLVKSSGFSELSEKLYPQNLIFPELAEVDNIRIRNNELYLETIFPIKLIKIDSQLLIKNSSLIWSHENLSTIKKSPLKTIKTIYIFRDGRDVINSQLHHVIRPQSLLLNKNYKYTTKEEIFSDFEYFERAVKKWVEHIKKSHSIFKDDPDVLSISFEEIVLDNLSSIKKISNFLGFNESNNYEDIINEINIKKSKSNLNKLGHLRKGKIGDWENNFKKEHLKIFEKYGSETLADLGYY